MSESLKDIAMAIYRSAFKDGEQVVVEDDQGKFIWGTLSTRNDGITITRINGKPDRQLQWKEITFMAHDGFPASKIVGMSDAAMLKFCWDLPTSAFRNALDALAKEHKERQKPPDEEKKPSETKPVKKAEPYRRVRFGCGCPFIFEDVVVKDLFFKGNNGPAYWGEWDEETLVLESKDGAILHSFDMSHLFLFDGLTLPGMTPQKTWDELDGMGRIKRVMEEVAV